ncbi:hypothetical protein WA556_005208, partial [Blastocystis sp. ATCC 50177/Nand II]
MPQVFWCYRCNKNVDATQQEDGNYMCNECHEPFVEIREEQEPLPNSNATQTRNGVSFQRLPNGGMMWSFSTNGTNSGSRVAGNFINSLLESFFPTQARFNGDYFNGNMSDLLNILMQNDPNHYGPPPTSRDFIDNMVRRHPTAAELQGEPVCSVCDSDITKDDIVVCLPCKHLYHPDCILPWIKKHNTCPTCRHPLPECENEDDMYHDEE